jgi:hypothetical protein
MWFGMRSLRALNAGLAGWLAGCRVGFAWIIWVEMRWIWGVVTLVVVECACAKVRLECERILSYGLVGDTGQ